MGSPHILVVDDDPGIRDLLALKLREESFAVDVAADGKAGWELFVSRKPDLVILDLLMPEVDGLELCRRIRRESATPIMMLTSRDAEMDVLLGLDTGADDYVTKPFSPRVLVARIHATLRRVALDKGKDARVVRAGALEVDRGTREIRLGGRRGSFTATEFELVHAFAANPGRAFTRDELITAVYGPDIHVDERTIDTFVKRVRAELRGLDPTFDAIETVRSVGYRLRG